jgi:hypothetical protein
LEESTLLGREESALEERNLLWKRVIYFGREESALEERNLLWKRGICSGG